MNCWSMFYVYTTTYYTEIAHLEYMRVLRVVLNGKQLIRQKSMCNCLISAPQPVCSSKMLAFSSH